MLEDAVRVAEWLQARLGSSLGAARRLEPHQSRTQLEPLNRTSPHEALEAFEALEKLHPLEMKPTYPTLKQVLKQSEALKQRWFH